MEEDYESNNCQVTRLELRNIKNVEFGKLKCLIVIKMREDIIIRDIRAIWTKWFRKTAIIDTMYFYKNL